MLSSYHTSINNHPRIHQHPHSKKSLAIQLWVGPSLLINMCDHPIKQHPAPKSDFFGVSGYLTVSPHWEVASEKRNLSTNWQAGWLHFLVWQALVFFWGGLLPSRGFINSNLALSIGFMDSYGRYIHREGFHGFSKQTYNFWVHHLAGWGPGFRPGAVVGNDVAFRCGRRVTRVEGRFGDWEEQISSGNDSQFAIETCHRNSWFTNE